MDIVAGNKLILEFMKIEPTNISGKWNWSDSPHFYVSYSDKEKTLNSMAEYSKYYLSWDWLMKVVDKITNDNHRFMVKTDEGQHWAEFWCYDEHGLIAHEIGCCEDESGTMISAVYSAVIEFIEWYNEKQAA